MFLQCPLTQGFLVHCSNHLSYLNKNEKRTLYNSSLLINQNLLNTNGDFEHNRLNILAFPSPTSHMLWSFGFSLLIWDIYSINACEMMCIFPQFLNLNRLFFKLNRFISSSVTCGQSSPVIVVLFLIYLFIKTYLVITCSSWPTKEVLKYLHCKTSLKLIAFQ